MKHLLVGLVLVVSLSLISSSYAVVYDGTKSVISIGFDHGFVSQYKAAMYMKTKNMSGTIYVVTNRTINTSFLSWSALHTFSSLGWEMASHSRTHVKEFDSIGSDKLYSEIVGSKYDLIQQGFTVCGFVPPADTINPNSNPITFDMIKENYNYTMKGFNKQNNIPSLNYYKNNFGIPIIMAYQVGDVNPEALGYIQNFSSAKTLIDNAIGNKNFIDIHFHDIINDTNTTGKQYPTSWSLFTQIINYIKLKSDSGQIIISTQGKALGC